MSTSAAERTESAPRLADSLGLILPSLPPGLVGSAASPWLTSVASALPPVHRAGFECRLAADEPEVDLQQGIFVTDGEPERLARFLMAAEALNDAWGAVLRLAERWAEPADPLHGGIAELWLELDAARKRVDGPLALNGLAPSVFAVLRNADPEPSLAVARTFVEAILGDTGSAGLDSHLMRFARNCPEPARISHIGLMLGRSSAGMRVHLSRIPTQGLDEYLVRIGWPGDRQEVLSLAEALLDYGDSLILCLDVVHGRVVRLGLECFFSENIGLDPRWRPLLDRLRSLGLSSADKADALLRWPGTITPLNSPDAWPQDLIAQSLTQPEHELGVLDRRLSHVKLSCVPDLPVSAKAYFGYGHVWTHDPVAARPASRPPARRPVSTVPDSIEAAVDWLLAARHQSGWWRDFPATPAVGFSDEWVTAYIGDALARAPLARARSAAADALKLLLTRRRDGDGWGFNVQLVPDGDATTWALRLAQSLGSPALERLEAARRLLSELTTPDGGVTSYLESAAPDVDRIMLVGGSYDGWCNAHMCITAPAARLGLSPVTAPYLQASQNADGSWSSYWWPDDEYATAWAVEALARSAHDDPAVVAGVAWSAGRIGEDGSVRSKADGEPAAFPTALALYAMRVGGTSDDRERWGPAADRAERWLLEHQLADGFWEPSARMRVPLPSVHDPSASPELILRYVGDSGVWTTATVVAALSAGASSRR